jgi:Protein of unknown function (DUF2905)
MEGSGKLLAIAGLVLTGVGADTSFKVVHCDDGRGWLRRLPGDIHVERRGWGLHFPIVTCILISIVLSILLNIFRR